jgi:anti-anti-sigma regulatory factor
MNIFLSWSGSRSGRAARALKHWVEVELAPLTAWASHEDLEPGVRWNRTLHEQLKGAVAGVLLVTRENLQSPWLLYEAGCLAIATSSHRIIPYLIDVFESQLPSPLKQFQCVPSSRDGAWLLIRELLKYVEPPRFEADVRRRFDATWEVLGRQLGLSLEVDDCEGVLVLNQPTVRLDDDGASAISSRLATEMLRGRERFVIDLTSVVEISEPALGYLVVGLGAAKKRNVAVALVICAEVRETLARVGISRRFRVFADRRMALDSVLNSRDFGGDSTERIDDPDIPT